MVEVVVDLICLSPGINETERQRRKKSNRLSTKITFIGWLIEV